MTTKSRLTLILGSFNSLQTGKWRQSRKGRDRAFTESRVSIPFKRESGDKVTSARGKNRLISESFNSLQTGKWRQRHTCAKYVKNIGKKFQFPSNGKVETKSQILIEGSLKFESWEVSIPFKRESGAKESYRCIH